ncbi:RDD family protein [Micromonospora peucetia]|uniref:RDD family protein n=1 Tax=Micromonospora peucetia TaxID=47871 RepID=A0ABZ1EM78_9ACTN|nr:RDD family protein [Micromonospora peucetia]WSA35330.1 RDD family protein [Micromonospora peucetia]
MTQPPTYPTPPAGGQPPAAGGFAPPSGPASQGYAVPQQHAPSGQVPPPGWTGPPPPGWAPPPPGWNGPPPPGWAPPPPGWNGPPPAGWTGPPPRPAPTLGPGGQPLATFGDRLLAVLIDGALGMLVVMVLLLPPLLILFWDMAAELTRANPDGTLGPQPVSFLYDFMLPLVLIELGLMVVMLGIYWLYYVEYMKRTGQTFGKRMMKLRIVPLDPTATLDRRMAGRRYAVQYLAAGLLPGLSYLDGLWQLWDKPWQQCLHDKFAGTVVVKVSA